MANLCIVAHIKNEARILASWLETHIRIADFLLIIDTGSTDGSQDIAHAFDVEVIDQEMSAGFGFIRSFCVEQARNRGADWCCILDADERILPMVDELQVVRSETETDMTTKWPAGPGAPQFAVFEAVPTGRLIDQRSLMRTAIEDPHIAAYQTRRRHWFDWQMRAPTQDWQDWLQAEGAEGDDCKHPDWQARFVRCLPGAHYVRSVHEWLRDHRGMEPSPMGAFGPDGPYFDHFHIPAKRQTPGRAEEVTAFCDKLYQEDTEHRGVTY